MVRAHAAIVDEGVGGRNGVPPYTFPVGLGGAVEGDLIERDEELALLADLMGAARARGRTVAIVGPPGIGKTTLLESARAAARDSGGLVLTARPAALERDLGFEVVRQLLTPVVADSSDAQRDSLLRDGAELALPALGLGAGPPGSDPLSDGLFGLQRLCVRLAESGPVTLVVDDAHWADDPSLRFLAHLGRRIGESRIQLLVGFRDAEPGAPEVLLDALLSAPGAVVVRPAELSAGGVAALVRRTYPDAHEHFVEACGRASGANPFYLGELLRACQAERLEPTAASAPRLERLTTTPVGRAAVERIDELGPGARDLARAAAIFPLTAESRHLAAIARLDDSAAAATADDLTRAGIVREGHPLEFVHPIIRTGVYEEIPPATRAELHRRAATLLMGDGGRAEDIVFHLLRADPAGDSESARILNRAAEGAIAAGAFEEAIAYATRALDEPPRPEERAAVLRGIGVAEGHLGLPEGMDHLRAAADAAPTPRLRAEILRQLGWGLLTAGRFVGVAQVLDEAIAGLGDEDRELALEIDADLVAAAQMAMLPPDVIETRLARYREAEPEGRTHGERCVLGVMAFEAIRRNDRADRAEALALRALPLGGEPVDITTALPLYLATLAFNYAEAFDDAKRVLLEGADRSAAPRNQAIYGLMLSYLALPLGDLDEALALAQTSLASEGSHGAATAPMASTVIADVHLEREETADALSALASVGLSNLPVDEMPFEQPLLSRARARWQTGDLDSALDDALACGERLKGRGSFGPAAMPWRSTLASIHHARGDADEARRWAAEEVALARDFGGRRTLGLALRVAGQVAQPSEQLALLEESVALLADSPARLERAKALIQMGAALRRARRRQEAREPLGVGMELARILNVPSLVSRAREELVAAGAKPRRIAQEGPESLTPSELRVILLAGESRSNREIATELVVTGKTVEMHLRNTYRKLGIASRKDLKPELVERLRELGSP